MENEKPRQTNIFSNLLFWIGSLLTFMGFIFPGWAWMLMFPSKTDTMPNSVMTVLGATGLLLLGIATVKRIRDNRIRDNRTN